MNNKVNSLLALNDKISVIVKYLIDVETGKRNIDRKILFAL